MSCCIFELVRNEENYMERILQNKYLEISVNERGAELCSVKDKTTGKELLWNADPEIWNRHAPLLFPYCGGVFNDTLLVDGKEYPAAKHGFARNMEFECILADSDVLSFRLQANDETKLLYPFDFVLDVTFTLEERRVNQAVKVINPSNDEKDILPFSIGFHPGFKIPFGEGTATNDYEIYFEKKETPVEIKTPNGYVSGEAQIYFTEESVLPLTNTLFAEDSICLSGLRSDYIGVRERKRPSNYIQVNTKDFPYVLLWSAVSNPLHFVCIEPWHGLPDGPKEYSDFREKNGVTLLNAGKEYETTLQMEFHIEK